VELIENEVFVPSQVVKLDGWVVILGKRFILSLAEILVALGLHFPETMHRNE